MPPIQAAPSDFVQFAIYMPSKGGVERFDFSKRRYLKEIYDSKAQRKLLMAGRQVEKCQTIQTLISSFDGKLIPAGCVRVGDLLATMDDHGVKITHGRVTWVSQHLTKPCLRIKTRQGHIIEIATTHPMRLWNRWVEGEQLKVGDRLAAVRQAGVFTRKRKLPDCRIRLTAYLIGDGGIGGPGCCNFTSLPGKKLNEFLRDLQCVRNTYKVLTREGAHAKTVRIHVGQIRKWLQEDGLFGHKSATKFIPDWVFDLDRRQTALFLNRLWSTDGHVKQNGHSKYSIEYCSISQKLIKQVQSLLWKFGIPSKIRENWPNIYKKRGEKRIAYILRVETQEGIRRFLTEVGAFTKSEKIRPPASGVNNNRDTYPKEINGLVARILASRGSDDWHGNRDGSLHGRGLRRTLKYAPTRGKLAQYIRFFRSDLRFDQELVDALERHLDTDLYWDEITEITKIGNQECVDFEVGGTHNFVAEGLVTHNSTLLGNTCLSYCAMNPFFRVLYVSPSNVQSKVFSRDRLKEPMEISPVLKHYSNSKLLSNVLEKKFVNQSQITLRFAFLNADRVRGIPADLVNIDEFQDILLENIPVIEECASHSEWKLFTYSGTPKSLDNSLEHYWTRFSTQNEWAVPCKHHGTPGNPSSWHWNILDEEHIGDYYLICDKCGREIFPSDPDCFWTAMNPHPKVEKPFDGYRLPQLMVPWIEFADIKDKQRKYSRAKFHNEVLGRSYDSGTRPLTRRNVQSNCWDQLSMQYYRDVIKWTSQYPVFMGIDWGSGEGSYTVVTLGGYLPFAPERFTYFYFHRFEGVESEPKVQLDVIKALVRDFSVRYIGVDYGGGHWPNDELVREFGAEKVKKYQWIGNPKKKIAFEPRLGVPRFLCHRTEVMSDIFNAIKRCDVFHYPRWEEFEDPFGSDFLNIFSEYNERLRTNVFKHAPGCPDDSFHASLYAFLASFFFKTRPDVILPTKEVDREMEDSAEDLDVK
jgi:intein/homing endonuclease